MKLVLGLGNPGPDYEGTRHNLGFEVVRAVARDLGIDLAPGPGPALQGQGHRAGDAVLLACPLTWMNRSGQALAYLDPSGVLDSGSLLVVLDDVDLVPGRVLLRASGSDGGHRGMRSIQEVLRTERIPRLRIGVGRGPDGVDTVEHVLSRPEGEEARTLQMAVAAAVQGVISWLDCPSIQNAMNQVNQKQTRSSGSDVPPEA